jgi:molybdate transport system substrate-binding protein
MTHAMRRLAWLLLALLGLPGCRRAPKTVLVFAASSTTDALKRLGADFERERGVRVDFSFAASSTLARQLEAGAPADLFLSADPAQLARVKAAGVVETARPLLGNRLVVVAQRGAPPLPAGCALAGFSKVALADPESVPAGVYAREWLTSRGCWAKVAPRVIPALNVRAALAQVESGAAPVGVVYATDAALSPGLQVLLTVPRDQAPPITYPLALTRHGAASQDARDLYSFLFSPKAQAAFARLGFTRAGR